MNEARYSNRFTVEGRPARKPGPKPGKRHAGQWKPGQSGNPSGRPRKTASMKALEELCRAHAETAVDLLRDTIADPDAPIQARLTAARELLDRGFGKSVDRSVALQLNKSADSDTGDDLTLAQLQRIASGAYRTAEGGASGGHVIDLRPVSDDHDD